MAQAVLFSGPTSPHVGRIEFSEPKALRGYFTCSATLGLDGEEWSVGLEMIWEFRSDMLGFFEELAASAEGWSGTKEWDSEFQEVSIRATSPGDGIAILDVVLCWPPEYEIQREGTIHVRLEELPRFAETMRSFLRMPEGGQRFIRVRPPEQ